jgi:hypothetical protein
MPTRIAAVVILICVSLLLAGTALGGAGVAVKITNDSTEDVFVTVYDRSIDPARVVLANERINGFASVPLHLVGDGTGRAKVSWTATSADSLTPKCGHADEVVSNGAAVNVRADSTCSGA